MNNNNSKRFNLYTQVQPWAVRVLLIVGLVSGPVNVLAGQGVVGPFKTAVVALVLGGQLSGVSSLGPLDECPSGDLSSCPIGGLRELRSNDPSYDHNSDHCLSYFDHMYQVGNGSWWQSTMQPILNSEGSIDIDVDFNDEDNFKSIQIRDSITTYQNFVDKLLGCIQYNALDPAAVRSITLRNLTALPFQKEFEMLEVDTKEFLKGLKKFTATNMGLENIRFIYPYYMEEVDISNNAINNLSRYMLDVMSKASLTLSGNHVCGLIQKANITGKNLIC